MESWNCTMYNIHEKGDNLPSKILVRISISYDGMHSSKRHCPSSINATRGRIPKCVLK